MDLYLKRHIYIHTYEDIYILIYSHIYNKIIYIYTIFETTEPASKFYWINQQVQPKPLYIYIYKYTFLSI